MTMPSIVNSDRSLFARSAPSATRRVSAISMRLSPPAAAASGRSATQRARTGLHLVVLCLALGLQRRRAQHRDLVAFLQAVVEDFRVIVVGDAEPDRLGDPGVAALHEHEARARTRAAVRALAEARARR